MVLGDRLLSALLVLCAAWWLSRQFRATPQPTRPAHIPVHADALRADDAPAWHREMKCDEAIPPVSVASARDVEVFVESFFLRRRDEADVWEWSYRVQFRNEGVERVQLLTRHWIFVDAAGRAHEVMGPGARGHTPVLEPGERWTYESGTTLGTSEGSMRGSFGFVSIRPGPARTFSAPFAVRAARLALSSSGKPVRVPCGPQISGRRLPTTSVEISRRVIVGVTSAAVGRNELDGSWAYELDVQVNNARDEPIALVGREWHVSSPTGGISRVVDSGAHGWIRHEPPRLRRARRLVQPGAAMRFGTVLSVPAELSGRAVASGHLLVCLSDSIPDDTGRGTGDGANVHEDVLDALCRPVQIEIGRLALSPDGTALAADEVERLDRGGADADEQVQAAGSESDNATTTDLR